MKLNTKIKTNLSDIPLVPKEFLLTKAREASTAPGVYLMKNTKGQILYVGKAKNLRNRLQTYFQDAPNESARIELLVSQIASFDVVLTETEAEALILECIFIKKHRPKFNVRLKDDKAYPYIKINQADFPHFTWVRRTQKDGARYFGPFPTPWAARQILRVINNIFRLRDCDDNTFYHRSRPCVLYQINRCHAPCVGKIQKDNYQSLVDQAIEVLEGKSEKLSDHIRSSMLKASTNEQYEAAAELRDQLKNLEIVTTPQAVDDAGALKSYDVIGFAVSDENVHVCLVKLRHGKIAEVSHFHMQSWHMKSWADEFFTEFFTKSQILFSYIAQYYVNTEKIKISAAGEVFSKRDLPFMDEVLVEKTTAPETILVPFLPDEAELLAKILPFSVREPEKEFEKKLLNVAVLNAQSALEQEKGKWHTSEALDEVKLKLHLSILPDRIECYDISNLQGGDAVGSRVVFLHGVPEKKLYRRYRIKTVKGANDFAMMFEVLNRRFHNVEEDLPDLIVIDGGKGQLSQVSKIFEELSIQGVGLVGLAKSKVERNFKSKEVTRSFERVYIPNRKNPIPLYPHTKAYLLLTHIRDEAHRFAIAYHRKLRQKRYFK
ncbi:MAG: excinuclease ABC subunit UvrC [Deltaproteobacteria bacterium]|nr:excinuclease ABC subunit UvrC [Deltaproteobacteria bacterium]